MTDHYDAIVVGARCAGATTAMLLAREGHRVLLLDRASFPSEIPHGHFIHMHGPQLLAGWGLLDEVLATGCPAVTSMVRDDGDFPLAAHDLAPGGVPVGLAPRRAALDHVLVRAAVRAGAELREGFAVDELLRDGERVTGIRGRAGRGSGPVSERATVVIGADGRNSMVARSVGAPAREAVPTLTCWYFSYWSDVPCQALEMYVKQQTVTFAFPTNDGLTGLAIGWPIAELGRVRADVDRAFTAALDHTPELAERVRAGAREERYYGATQLPNFLRKPHGPGWALVGDAGCHKDPLMALGICDALRDAGLLADALRAGLAGELPIADALAGYERHRDAATTEAYRANIAAAALAPLPPEAYALRASLRDDPEAARRFFLARQGRLEEDAVAA